MLPCCLLEGVQNLPEIVQATPQDSVSELLMTTRGQADGMDTCSNVPLLQHWHEAMDIGGVQLFAQRPSVQLLCHCTVLVTRYLARAQGTHTCLN